MTPGAFLPRIRGFARINREVRDDSVQQAGADRGLWLRLAMHAADPAQTHSHTSAEYHRHRLRRPCRGAAALDRPGSAVRAGKSRSRESWRGVGQASGGRRNSHRFGLEHRLLRNRPVVPRSGRAVLEHVGRSLGSLRPRAVLSSHAAHAVPPAHEPAADAGQVVQTRTDGCVGTRRESGADLAFHQTCAP